MVSEERQKYIKENFMRARGCWLDRRGIRVLWIFKSTNAL